MPAPPRCLPNFLTAFEEWAELLPAHSLFKRWAAIFLISAALSRKVWDRTNPIVPYPIYPNIWANFIGQPGSGKDMAINTAVNLLRMTNEKLDPESQFYFGARGLSPKGFLDAFDSDDAQKTFDYDTTEQKITVMLSCIPELGTTLREYNQQLISYINEIYNCGDEFDDQVRGTGKAHKVVLKNPYLGMLWGCQPESFVKIFPESAYRSGYGARIILVYAEDVERKPVFYNLSESETSHLDKLKNFLTSDLASMTKMVGQMKFDPEVKEALNEFSTTGCDKTALKHSRFKEYNTRRWFHLHKLSMIFSASRTSSMCVTMEDLTTARDTLFEVETQMPLAFTNLATDNGFHETIEEILTQFKPGNFVNRRQLEPILQKRHKPYETEKIIDSLVKAGQLQILGTTAGVVKYKVIGRH